MSSISLHIPLMGISLGLQSWNQYGTAVGWNVAVIRRARENWSTGRDILVSALSSCSEHTAPQYRTKAGGEEITRQNFHEVLTRQSFFHFKVAKSACWLVELLPCYMSNQDYRLCNWGHSFGAASPERFWFQFHLCSGYNFGTCACGRPRKDLLLNRRATFTKKRPVAPLIGDGRNEYVQLLENRLITSGFNSILLFIRFEVSPELTIPSSCLSDFSLRMSPSWCGGNCRALRNDGSSIGMTFELGGPMSTQWMSWYEVFYSSLCIS